MEIIKIRNNHIEPESEYGCVCAKCGTAFIFKAHEIIPPWWDSGDQRYGLISCPHCLSSMMPCECQEFASCNEKEEFIKLHTKDEQEELKRGSNLKTIS